MSLPRVFTSGLSCRACRVASTTSFRSFVSTARQATIVEDDRSTAPPTLESTTTTSTTTPADDIEARPEPLSTSASSLPWYLQNRPAPSPQQASIIPDLPPNPPPLLSTLLDYISNTAGLDDLLILDLRTLDPPPALGPKLIMILCTARSEKHLHVSADRFCRWLRREHHLRANAAGLLGRNELKIKLRRKAKRMKMLANVGATEEGNLDDGIRTGWICCTVGKIEAHAEDAEIPGVDVEGFVGFRDVKPGVNVVFQMFTEEKRAETDLETLWGGVLRTGDRKDKVAEERLRELEESLEEIEVALDGDVDEVDEKFQTPRAQRRAERAERAEKEEKEKANAQSIAKPVGTPPPTHQFTTARPSTGDSFPPASNAGKFQQIRRLHSVGLRI